MNPCAIAVQVRQAPVPGDRPAQREDHQYLSRPDRRQLGVRGVERAAGQYEGVSAKLRQVSRFARRMRGLGWNRTRRTADERVEADLEQDERVRVSGKGPAVRPQLELCSHWR
jgi:hypothetical protein